MPVQASASGKSTGEFHGATSADDVYAFGALMVEMVTGAPNFPSNLRAFTACVANPSLTLEMYCAILVLVQAGLPISEYSGSISMRGSCNGHFGSNAVYPVCQSFLQC